MKYTFFYYDNQYKLVYAGNCVDVNKVYERHKKQYEFGYAQNGYDACFYKYLRDNNITIDDLHFESCDAEWSTSEEVIRRLNPLCNKKIPIESLTCLNECYIYKYMWGDLLLYIKSSLDVDEDHKKNIEKFEKSKRDMYMYDNIYLFDYMKVKGVTFDDITLVSMPVKVANMNELYDLEDEFVMKELPICNTTLNCVRSQKDMFKDLHEDILNINRDNDVLKFKMNMRKKLMQLYEN
jgi:hypothetical protein